MIAPVGSNVRSLSASAERFTVSIQRPRYCERPIQRRQNSTVARNSPSVASGPRHAGQGPPGSISPSTNVALSPSFSTSSPTTPSPSRASGTVVASPRQSPGALKHAPPSSSVSACRARA